MIRASIDEFLDNKCDETFVKMCYCLRTQEVYFLLNENYLLKYPDKEIADDYFKENDFLLETISVNFESGSWLLACPKKSDLEKHKPNNGVILKSTIRNLFREFIKYPIDGGVVYDYWGLNMSFDNEILNSFAMLDEFFEEGKV